jgi:ariadne-1
METFRRVSQISDSISDDLSVSDHSIEHLITEGNQPISEETNSVMQMNEMNEINEINELKELKDRSRLCFVCDGSKIEIFFSCGNGLCLECILEHIKAQIAKYKIKILSEKIKFVCAGSCKCPVDSELMESFMNLSVKEMYEEVLLKMYLSKAKDVVTCPKSDCKGCGYVKQPNCEIPTVFNLFITARTCLECPVCKHQWSDSEEKVLNYFDPRKLGQNFSFSNLKSLVKKYVTTKYCNKCTAPIEKAEGCKHIECNRCEYSFCWKCTEDWKTHNEKSCMGLYTNEYDDSFRPQFGANLFLLLSFLFLTKFLFTFLIIFKIIWLVIKLGLFFFFLLIDAFFLHGALLNLYKYNNRNKFYMILLIGVLFELSIFYFRLHPYSEKIYLCSQILFLPMYACVMAVKKKFS